MSWTFCTSGAAIVKAGANCNSGLKISGSILADWSDQAEALINTYSRKDWIAEYASVGTNFKNILGDVCSDLIAMKMINYDQSGYISRAESSMMLDVLRDNITRSMGILRNDDNKEVMI